MCGVAGVLGPGASQAATVAAMAASLVHRGPDGEGIWKDESGLLALAHRRLAILDLSPAGAQPMTDASGRWVISFNGEIYNHRQLRQSLAGICRAWRGTSDTEVLLEAIAAWGLAAALAKCEGMFAFALWDRQARDLVLVRDRMGERPLYVGWVGRDIAFGSELGALRVHPEWRGGIVEPAVSAYLRWGFIPAPMSIHPGVFKLPAGTLLRLRPSDAGVPFSPEAFQGRLEHYWRLSSVVDSARQDPWRGSFDEAVGAAQSLLDRAVACRMQADVPVGALLSGGVDSSLVVESMQRQSPIAVKTFTVGFDDAAIDESAVASRVARLLGTEHHALHLPMTRASELARRAASVYDEPFADVAQLPAMLVSQAVRNHVTVALTGDAGDELFAGYQRYRDCARAWAMRSALPNAAARVVGLLMKGLAAADPGRCGRLPVRADRSLGRWRSDRLDDFYEDWLAFPGSPVCRGTSLAEGVGQSPLAPLSAMARMRFLDQGATLPEGIHTKLDRASMAYGLELRVPLLDSSLVAFSWRLPERWLRRGPRGKVILRALLARTLPGGIAARPKQGFDVPIGAWLRGGLREWAGDLISSGGNIPGLDILQLRRSFEAHLAGRVDHGHALWAALVLIAWGQRDD